jgi:hypothetical protein
MPAPEHARVMRFLDVAAGGGALSIPAARLGLKDVRVETASHGMEVPSAIDLWGMLTSAAPATGALVASLTKGQRSAVRKALDGLFRQRFGAGPAVLSMQVHVGIGTR